MTGGQGSAIKRRAKLALAAAIGLAALFVGSAARAEEFSEERTFFRVNIGGHSYRLEGLVVKRADATGPLPIALITHGKAAHLGGMLDVRAAGFDGQARDLARRGWLAVVVVRRGFGNSDGPIPVAVKCDTTSFVPAFEAAADDLQATLDVVAQRPDADASRIIAIGVSAGGASVVALGARNPKGLLGVINVSGGLRMEECSKEDVLVDMYRQYGVTSRVPNLWLYAKNDSFFGPDLVERMREAYLNGGGDAKLVMFEPLGDDGHRLFGMINGRALWLMQMDGFLHAHGLPTWRQADVDDALKRFNLPERARSLVENYIAAPSERVLIRAPQSGRLFYQQGADNIEAARNAGLKRCHTSTNETGCAVIMENDTVVGPDGDAKDKGDKTPKPN